MDDLKLDGESINRLISKAILESAIGKELNSAIKKQVDEMSRSYNNPLEPVIRSEIQKIIVQILLNEYNDLLRDKIREQLANLLTSEFISKIIETGLKQREKDW